MSDEQTVAELAEHLAYARGVQDGFRENAAVVTLAQDWFDRNELNMDPASAMELREILTGRVNV